MLSRPPQSSSCLLVTGSSYPPNLCEVEAHVAGWSLFSLFSWDLACARLPTSKNLGSILLPSNTSSAPSSSPFIILKLVTHNPSPNKVIKTQNPKPQPWKRRENNLSATFLDFSICCSLNLSTESTGNKKERKTSHLSWSDRKNKHTMSFCPKV